jgi:hypothetical protein
MTDRPIDKLPEHERRPERDIGGGVIDAGGTAPILEEDPRAAEVGFDEEGHQPESDIDDPDPEDPNGPEVAFQPRPL